MPSRIEVDDFRKGSNSHSARPKNTLFPFSSPNIDEHTSTRSGRTGESVSSKSPFASPNSSTTTLTDYESGGTSDHDEWHLERYSQDTKSKPSMGSTLKVTNTRRRARPGLQIVTDFPKPEYYPGGVLIDQVQARKVKTRRNKARSIVSQKGIRLDSESPQHEQRTALHALKELVRNNKHKRDAAVQQAQSIGIPVQQTQLPRAQKPVIRQRHVPAKEAQVCRNSEYMDSAITLQTPATPAIILTLPDDISASTKQFELAPAMLEGQQRPTSSLYSPHANGRGFRILDNNAPPVLTNSESKNLTLMHHNPFRKWAEPGSARSTEEESDHINSAGTPRPLSQGWWNLMLSPMLSRAGSMVSRKGFRTNDSPPPVPMVPADFEKQLSATPPGSHMSPETPRRLGLASPEGASWASWHEKKSDQSREIDSTESGHVASEHEKVFPTILTNSHISEGLAAEYYHACAIEQLAGITYFECINHSCAERLPKLQSIHDGFVSANLQGQNDRRCEAAVGKQSGSQDLIRGLALLGGPFENGEFVAKIDQLSNDPDSISAIRRGAQDKHIGTKDRQPILLPALSTSDHPELTTPIESESEPDELSPNVRKANTAAVVRARALGTDSPARAIKQRNPMSRSESRGMVNIAAIVPKKLATSSPELPSPAGERSMQPTEGIAMTMLPINTLPQSAQHFAQPEVTDSFASQPSDLSYRQTHLYMSVSRPSPQSRIHFHDSARRSRSPQEAWSPPMVNQGLSSPTQGPKDSTVEKIQGNESGPKRKQGATFWKRCMAKRTVENEKAPEKRKKRRCLCCLVLFFLLCIIALCLALAMTLTRRGDATPVDQRWLNLTGYPPMPTGISTIAQPDLARSESRCLSPSTLWTCSLPKEDQATVGSNKPDQPNFRFEIKFRNGTTPANMTIALHRRATDPFTDDLFEANPAAPNQADQTFLGRTTDNITAPFDGEMTPFYMSFMSAFPVIPSSFNTTKRAIKRQTSDLESNIPPPAQSVDGTATSAALLPTDPYPLSQPIKLYNRGLMDEHYGFYMYYDKSLFLSGISITNGKANTSQVPPEIDQNGGSPRSDANVRCTWQQTRFVVRMYTNPSYDAVLLDRPNVISSNVTGSDASGRNETYSSAIDFSRPGSFPYPTTISIDRHGGNINSKIIYCYGMDSGQRIELDQKSLVFEQRSYGGTLVNPAPTFLNEGNGTSPEFNSSAGGIDGGTGGCGCQWQNWR